MQKAPSIYTCTMYTNKMSVIKSHNNDGRDHYLPVVWVFFIPANRD